MNNAKPFSIDRREVLEAFEQVKENDGAAGVDRQSIADFEKDLKKNLYVIWNRLSSGSYMPPPVLEVEIPKEHGGGMRTLGIPTVADRVAQMVVKNRLERVLEPLFHTDSYGYRPGRSALDAVRVTRQRCWKYDWVIDVDIWKFFDTIPWDLLMRAVQKHTQERWIVLHIERWLKAPMQTREGTVRARTMGTPQGGVVSPLLANLFLHYAFDQYMVKHHKSAPFARYADDAVVHCRSKKQARTVLLSVYHRLQACGLGLHPDKTKIVYCQDSVRRMTYKVTSFDFLGFAFRQRTLRNRKGELSMGFNPAISRNATRKIKSEMRTWKVHRQTKEPLNMIAKQYNPKIRGWLQYYGSFSRHSVYDILRQFQDSLELWARRKYKRLRRSREQAYLWLRHLSRTLSVVFAHWCFVTPRLSTVEAG